MRFTRNIKVRLVSVFIAFALVIGIVIGVSLNSRIRSAYYSTFRDGIVRGYDKWLEKNDWTADSMRSVSVYDAARLLSDNSEAKIYFFLASSYRTFSLMSGDGSQIITSNDKDFGVSDNSRLILDMLSSKNVVKVMAGADRGDSANLVRTKNGSFFDYAIRLKLAEGDYILYFKYDSQEWANVIDNFNRSIISSLLLAILAAVVMGVILSQTITDPIKDISQKAKQLAGGDFDIVLEVKSDDEIGTLTSTFNNMASELKSNMLQISSDKNKVETILWNMTDGIMAFSMTGEQVHVNQAAVKMLGLGICTLDFDGMSAEYGFGISLSDLAGSTETVNKESHFAAGEKYIRAYLASYKDDAGNLSGIILVLQDTTEQQKAEKIRKEFIENVSHELWTPITSIKSYSETLLEDDPDEATRRKFLSVINSEADRMTILVKDLRQLSNLDHIKTLGESNSVKLAITRFSLPELVLKCVEKLKMDIKGSDYRIGFTVSGDVPEVEADYDKIQQVLVNILSNAVKYTPEGGTINATAGAAGGMAYIRVSDTGIGISRDDLPRVFERFYRVDKARSRQAGGTGLGLAIAKEIIDLHGGEIEIKSKLDKGTEVTFKLPINRI